MERLITQLRSQMILPAVQSTSQSTFTSQLPLAGFPTPPTLVVPMVIENTGRVERAFDIYSLLLRERIVFLGTPIDDEVANLIVAQLLYLDGDDQEKDIHLYINSPGGEISAGLAIYDTMHAIPPNI